MTGRRIAGAVALVAALTVVSRLAGFGRIVVFNATVGPTELGDLYHAANLVPNIVFELVAGGALASLVVPLLAGAAAVGDRAAVSRIVSALLTGAVALLAVAGLAVAIAADPLVALIAPRAAPTQAAAGADMLRVFAPQLPLYGVGIVLTGVLQTYRRFAWPVLAPLLSSLTVIVVYVAFGVLAGRSAALNTVTDTELLLLSGGTTLAVAVLSLCLLIPLRGLRLTLRPALRLDGDTLRTLRPLAVAGIVVVGSQQLVQGLAVAQADYGPDGSVVVFALAQTVYLLPWAVLALPVATTTYPALAEAAANGEPDRFAGTLAPANRTVWLLSGLGVAGLLVLADPAAVLLSAVAQSAPAPGRLTAAIAAFAPGLLGYGLFALLSRALYARGDAYLVAGVTALGWAVAAVGMLVAGAALPAADRVAALGIGNSAGMLVLGAGLLAAVRRRAGGPAVRGSFRTITAAVTGVTTATAAGLGIRALVSGSGPPSAGAALAQGMLCGAVTAVVFLVTAALVDRDGMAPLAGRIRRRGGPKGGSAS